MPYHCSEVSGTAILGLRTGLMWRRSFLRLLCARQFPPGCFAGNSSKTCHCSLKKNGAPKCATEPHYNSTNRLLTESLVWLSVLLRLFVSRFLECRHAGKRALLLDRAEEESEVIHLKPVQLTAAGLEDVGVQIDRR